MFFNPRRLLPFLLLYLSRARIPESLVIAPIGLRGDNLSRSVLVRVRRHSYASGCFSLSSQ